MFSRRQPERNELFLPGRMAYVIDLEDDMMESDIPTTLIRSKADCPSLEVGLVAYCSWVALNFEQLNKIFELAIKKKK